MRLLGSKVKWAEGSGIEVAARQAVSAESEALFSLSTAIHGAHLMVPQLPAAHASNSICVTGHLALGADSEALRAGAAATAGSGKSSRTANR